MSHDFLYPILEKLLIPIGKSSFRVHRMSGGGNNQAYRVEVGYDNYFLKLYHQDPEDPRLRGKTEYCWLRTLWDSGIRQIPKPYSFEQTDGFSAGLYEFIQGRAIHAEDINEQLIGHAFEFIKTLNSVRNDKAIKELPVASEACFSYREHWQMIERRVNRLQLIDAKEGPLFANAANFVKQSVLPIWHEISSHRPQDFDSSLPLEQRILSPSDFGYHNALLVSQNKVQFIDFEYAGWDDPAKLICDFFNQVAVPVPMDYYQPFVQSFVRTFSPGIALRVENLFPLYQLKWTCILLNHFLPVDGRRKKFALQNTIEWETLLSKQLRIATSKLHAIKHR